MQLLVCMLKYDSQSVHPAHLSTVTAFDGFNMVPSLKPLETLHNNLTMQDMDVFLGRATTSKFFTPLSSPLVGSTPSPRCPEFSKTRC